MPPPKYAPASILIIEIRNKFIGEANIMQMFTCVNCKKSLYNSVIGVGICNGCCAVELPFFAASNIEFELLTNNKWADLGSRCDEYHLPQTLANKSLHASPNDFFLLHFNVRSLSKNKDKIDEFLHDFERLPDLVAISETKLNENSIGTSNISIPNYCFLRNDSPSNAGGVGIYIKESFKFRIRKNFFSKFQIVRIYGSKLKPTSQTNHLFVLLFIGTPTKICKHFKISYVILCCP